jgi:hypothetical protein
MPTSKMRISPALQRPPLAKPLRIRAAARRIPFARFTLSTWLTNTLGRHGFSRVGDLHGRTLRDLLALPRFGLRQVWELVEVLQRGEYLAPGCEFPRSELPRASPPKKRPPPPAPMQIIRVREHGREKRFEDLLLSTWLETTMSVHGFARVGDLHGRRLADLYKLRRFGRVQARELFDVLARHDLLEPTRVFSFDAPRAERLAALADLPPLALPHVVATGSPRFVTLRHLPIAIARAERTRRIDELPLPTAIKNKLRARGYARLGDLEGVLFVELIEGRRRMWRYQARILYGMLRVYGALSASPPPFDVPAKWRRIPLSDVPMPNPLRNALEARRVRKLGDLAKLTAEDLGAKFGPVRSKSLRKLVGDLRSGRGRLDGSPSKA